MVSSFKVKEMGKRKQEGELIDWRTWETGLDATQHHCPELLLPKSRVTKKGSGIISFIDKQIVLVCWRRAEPPYSAALIVTKFGWSWRLIKFFSKTHPQPSLVYECGMMRFDHKRDSDSLKMAWYFCTISCRCCQQGKRCLVLHGKEQLERGQP